MLLNKSFKNICLILLVTLGGIGYANAKAPLFSCPASFVTGDKVYPLNNASLFDGPVEKQVELVPEMTKNTRKWDIDSSMDPYLICRFDKVKHTIAFHVVSTTQCIVNENPFTVQCN